MAEAVGDVVCAGGARGTKPGTRSSLVAFEGESMATIAKILRKKGISYSAEITLLGRHGRLG